MLNRKPELDNVFIEQRLKDNLSKKESSRLENLVGDLEFDRGEVQNILNKQLFAINSRDKSLPDTFKTFVKEQAQAKETLDTKMSVEYAESVAMKLFEDFIVQSSLDFNFTTKYEVNEFLVMLMKIMPSFKMENALDRIRMGSAEKVADFIKSQYKVDGQLVLSDLNALEQSCQKMYPEINKELIHSLVLANVPWMDENTFEQMSEMAGVDEDSSKLSSVRGAHAVQKIGYIKDIRESDQFNYEHLTRSIMNFVIENPGVDYSLLNEHVVNVLGKETFYSIFFQSAFNDLVNNNKIESKEGKIYPIDQKDLDIKDSLNQQKQEGSWLLEAFGLKEKSWTKTSEEEQIAAEIIEFNDEDIINSLEKRKEFNELIIDEDKVNEACNRSKMEREILDQIYNIFSEKGQKLTSEELNQLLEETIKKLKNDF